MAASASTETGGGAASFSVTCASNGGVKEDWDVGGERGVGGETAVGRREEGGGRRERGGQVVQSQRGEDQQGGDLKLPACS